MKKVRNGFIKKFSLHCLIGVIALGLMTIIGTGCAGGDGDGDGGETPASAVDGRVKDTAGNPIEGVEIVGGGLTSSTGSDGSFLLALDPGKDQIVTFSREGYVTSSRQVDVFSGTTTSHIITLMAEGDPVTVINAENGLTVTGSRKESLVAPEGAFVDAGGNAVTGNIQVYLTPFDPAVPEQFSAYPGNLRGLTLDGDIVTLETFGVMDVTVRQNDQDLQIADGKTVDIRIPAPSSGQKPDTSDMWTYDADRGLWVQNETGATYDSVSDTYQATLSHLTPCNVDRPYVPACIWGMVKDRNGDPVAGAFVEVIPVGKSSGVTSSDFTDLNGYYCLYVERNQELEIKVWTPWTSEDECTGGEHLDDSCITTIISSPVSNTASGTYPMDCSVDCKQIRSLEVGQDDPGPLNEAACAAVATTFKDPFTSTCAWGLTDFYECFAPEGECKYELDLSSMTYVVEFESGSIIESTFGAFGMETIFYGPDPFNLRCGTMTYSDDGTTITTEYGQSYTIRNLESGGFEIECSGGQTFTLSPEQLDFLAGCSATTGDDDSGAQCKAKDGTFGADCEFDFECDSDSGLECCGPIFGEKTCQIAYLCDLLCEDDLDCTSPQICCDAGGYNMCLPAEACQ